MDAYYTIKIGSEDLRMRMYDLIEKKRDGRALLAEEISYMVEGYVQEHGLDVNVEAMTPEELMRFIRAVFRTTRWQPC